MTKIYLSAIVFFVSSGICAQDFSITDPTFGTDGRATINQGVASTGSSDNQGRRTMHVLSNDDIIVVGTGKQSGTDYDVFVGKFQADGTVDSNFGTSGAVFINTGGTADEATGSDIGPNGEIFITGTYIDPFGTGFRNILVVSLNANGTLNTNFSDDGILTTNISSTSTSEGRDIKALSDGSVLVAFRTSVTSNNPGIEFAVMKLTPQGEPDESFGENGIAVIVDPVTADNVYRLALQDDGKIILGGIKNTNPVSYQFIRLDENGTIDEDFGTGGIVTITHNDSNIPNLFFLTVESDGKILAGGNTSLGGGSSMASVVRLNSDGSPDDTFGNQGRVSLGLPTTARAVLRDGSDDYYVIGTDLGDVVSTKITSTGALVNTFGVNGTANFGNTIPNGVDVCGAMQSDGKFLIAGRVSETGIQKYGILRAGGPEIGTGIQMQESEAFSVYPNPAQHTITVRKADTGLSTCTISDLQGRILLKSQINSLTTIPVDGLSGGMYLLNIEGESVKIIIEK